MDKQLQCRRECELIYGGHARLEELCVTRLKTAVRETSLATARLQNSCYFLRTQATDHIRLKGLERV